MDRPPVSPKESLPASDLRLRDHPRFATLRDNLVKRPWLEPSTLLHCLGLPPSVEGVGLGRLLVQAGFITPVELERAKERKRENPTIPQWQALIDIKVLGDVSLALAYAALFNLPFVVLKTDAIQAEAIRHLDGTNAARWEAIPLRLEDNAVRLAVADPNQVEIESATMLADRPIRLVVAPRKAVLEAIRHWYGDERDKSALHAFNEIDLRALPDADTETLAADGNTIELVNRIILDAIQKRASDIHVIPEDRFVLVRYRIDGTLVDQARLPAGQRAHVIARIKIVSGMDIAERRLPQDGHIRVRLSDRMLDIRVSDLPSVRGESLVLRILDQNPKLVKLDELGFYPEDREVLRRVVSLPYGLILLTGPTGSGKSTTLRAAIQFLLEHNERHVLTVEDPVEVKLDGITQVQVNAAIEFTFSRALRNFLRHDPDVILVGEMRDGETARIAIQAALTGHLVLSTLHTNDAAGAVVRMIDMGVESYLVSSALTLIIAQRLVRAICPRCVQPFTASDDELNLLMAMGYVGPHPTLKQGKGCDHCGGTGYYGRTVIYELLPMDEHLKSLAARGEPAATLRQAARDRGIPPLIASGLRKVLEGRTTIGEVVGYLDTITGIV